MSKLQRSISATLPEPEMKFVLEKAQTERRTKSSVLLEAVECLQAKLERQGKYQRSGK